MRKRHAEGTYDNAATNAAILNLMLEGTLPEYVLVAFTGDEERGCKGAKHLMGMLSAAGVTIRHLFVLDVTDMGWVEGSDFTIENDFWHDGCGRGIGQHNMKRAYVFFRIGACHWK